MDVIINGETRQIKPQTLRALLETLDFADKRVAVELNGEIIPKSAHADTTIRAQDRIEIVVAVGGG
ncbi:MAG TPA: sulfur carrier protein ThiS [Paenalcaligenes sp.]|nr:sulfur carrier protein ThiS [Paenalcaligenes sp.]